MKISVVTTICVLSALTTMSNTAIAHTLIIPSYCKEPTKPYKFNTDYDKYDVNRYKTQTDKYKECITDFIDEQKLAIDKHRATSNAAIDEWNSFIRQQ